MLDSNKADSGQSARKCENKKSSTECDCHESLHINCDCIFPLLDSTGCVYNIENGVSIVVCQRFMFAICRFVILYFAFSRDSNQPNHSVYVQYKLFRGTKGNV